ncbi:helix-turn-helix domain-containing protein [Aeromicrobium ginsengisoli]|uniref:GAF domain-containing protein n=1 Tax=Aeromicrobium ginsengisoli TaxID=363867 RepID=A0A5M4FJX7_9ACTN|nr:helix-turn-helix domain-containing protein [Aeromicrobium ginsengisoli]KAA1400258.1 GAF domain-containing protein [Aeromicrobium ginsengisoli]
MTAHTVEDNKGFERSLLSVAYRAADLAVMESSDEVISAVVRGAREMFGSDVAYFTMHDEKTDEFYVRQTEGFLSEAFINDRSTIRGFGIYGFIIDHLRPFWTSDYEHDGRFRHHPINVSSIHAEGIAALAGAPARLPGRPMPAVVFVGFRSVRDFSDDEIALLVAWGKVGGAAVENALRREALAAEIAEIGAAAEAHRSEASALRHMADVQGRLAEISMNGGTLDELVEALSEILRAPVAVRDESHGTQSASAQPVTGADLDAAASESFEARHAVVAGSAGVAAIRGQTQFLGSVVARFGQPPVASDLQTLEVGAIHIAGLMLSRDRLVAASNRAMADIVIGLLREPQDDLEGLAVHAARHGVQLQDSIRMYVVDVGGLASGRALERVRQELGNAPGLVGFFNGSLVLLASEERADDTGGRLLRALSREDVKPTVAVSSDVADPIRLPGAFTNVQRSLRLALALGRRGEVVFEAELAPYATVFGRLSADELDSYLEGLIGPLLAYDRGRGTDLATTLRIYLTAGESVRGTADATFLHPNTVRQRLATITSVLPALEDPERRLDIHLALRLHALRHQSV